MAMHEVILRSGVILRPFHINCPLSLLPDRIEKLICAANETYGTEHLVKAYKTITCAHCGHPDSHDNGSLRTGCAHDGCGCEIFQISSKHPSDLISNMMLGDYLNWKSRIDNLCDQSE